MWTSAQWSRPGWWHEDDMFIRGVHWGSKSTRGWVVRKDDSRSGGPCVFRRMGDSLGVNSGTLRLTCQVWPCSSFEQDNPGGHTMPACWGICTWRTESLEGLKGGMQVRSLIFMCVCVSFITIRAAGLHLYQKHNTLWAFGGVFTWRSSRTSKHCWKSA